MYMIRFGDSGSVHIEALAVIRRDAVVSLYSLKWHDNLSQVAQRECNNCEVREEYTVLEWKHYLPVAAAA